MALGPQLHSNLEVKALRPSRDCSLACLPTTSPLVILAIWGPTSSLCYTLPGPSSSPKLVAWSLATPSASDTILILQTLSTLECHGPFQYPRLVSTLPFLSLKHSPIPGLWFGAPALLCAFSFHRASYSRLQPTPPRSADDVKYEYPGERRKFYVK